MRILHFITSLRTGGAERLVCDLLPRFRDAGHEAVLLLMDGTRTPLYEELEKEGIRIDALSEGWRAMRNPLLAGRLVRYLKEHPFDVVHTHNTSCQYLAAIASLRLPLALVTTEHNTSNRRRAWKWFLPLERRMYGRYRRIICVGEETRRELLEHLGNGPFEDKTTVVPNGIDLSRFRQAVPDPDILGIPGFKVTMAAAFRAQKDHTTLIRALQELPPGYTLLLAGGAETREDRQTREQCRGLVRQLDLEDRVRFLGVRPDVPGLLAASDVVVLASHFEGRPLSAIEGMASGKAFIASDVDGLHELVDGAGILVPHGDPEELARRIRQACEDRTYAESVRKRCLNRAESLDIEKTTAHYIEIYGNIINFNT